MMVRLYHGSHIEVKKVDFNMYSLDQTKSDLM